MIFIIFIVLLTAGRIFVSSQNIKFLVSDLKSDEQFKAKISMGLLWGQQGTKKHDGAQKLNSKID